MTITYHLTAKDWGATANFKGGRTFTRNYIALSPKTDNEYTVTAAIGIQYGDGLDIDASAVCTEIVPTISAELCGAFVWEVRYTYTSNSQQDFKEAAQPNGASPQSPSDRPQNPTARLPTWKVSFRKEEKAIRDDLDGNPLVNSAGLPFIPPQTRPHNIAVISVEINLATFSLQSATFLLDHVNDDTYFGFDAETLKITGVEATTAFENSQAFWKVNWTFEYEPDGWNPFQVLDSGFSWYDSDSDQFVKFRDAFGAEMSEPQLLDGSGLPLATGGTPVWLDFTMYPTADFSAAIV